MFAVATPDTLVAASHLLNSRAAWGGCLLGGLVVYALVLWWVWPSRILRVLASIPILGAPIGFALVAGAVTPNSLVYKVALVFTGLLVYGLLFWAVWPNRVFRGVALVVSVAVIPIALVILVMATVGPLR
jgi:hypothetical protein